MQWYAGILANLLKTAQLLVHCDDLEAKTKHETRPTSKHGFRKGGKKALPPEFV
jgi:hypothetical protein